MDRDLKEFVWDRAGRACEYCQMPQALDDLPFEIDHIVALKHGGKTLAGNLALSCYYCNSFKGPNLSGIDPLSRKLAPLLHPRRHKWSRHLRWNGGILIGLTAVGRTTIRVLEINDADRVAMREELIQEKVFPPLG